MLAPEVVQSAERRVGQTICGKWRLDRVIGIGGMAAVYEATHRNRNQVAIKLLHPALSLEEGTRRRFLREGYVANTIRHQGAVQVLDDDVTDDGVAFLVMELLRGESVEERMHRRGGALAVHEALDLGARLLDILGAAHDQKVIHRDIKPDNIFLTDAGEVKVLDFGIARLNQGDHGLTQVGSFMGTPAFCAQEQARGRWDDVDHRTDIFSVGATLFTCLTGEHVHQAETSSEQLALAISSRARSLAQALPGAPPELVELVDTSLAYEKEDRYQSARAMKAAVVRVAAGLPASAKRVRAVPVTTPTIGPPGFDPDSVVPPGFRGLSNWVRLLLGLVLAGLLALLLFLVFREEGRNAGPEVAPSPFSVEAGKSAQVPSASAGAEKEVISETSPNDDSAEARSAQPLAGSGPTKSNRATTPESVASPKGPNVGQTPKATPRILPSSRPKAPLANKEDPFGERF